MDNHCETNHQLKEEEERIISDHKKCYETIPRYIIRILRLYRHLTFSLNYERD